MTQFTFADIPASRNTDADTSHAAIANHTGRERNAQKVWFAVRDNDRMTYRELANVCGLDPVEVMRRLNDLHRSGMVHKAEPRLCSTNGNRMTTWTIKGA